MFVLKQKKKRYYHCLLLRNIIFTFRNRNHTYSYCNILLHVNNILFILAIGKILLLSEFSCSQVVQYYNQYIYRVSLDPRLLSHVEREPGTHCLHMRKIPINSGNFSVFRTQCIGSPPPSSSLGSRSPGTAWPQGERQWPVL